MIAARTAPAEMVGSANRMEKKRTAGIDVEHGNSGLL
jgi:hypothetical protein